MNKVNNLWKKLNFLVENPNCETSNDDYDLIVWNDARAQPTLAEIQAVSDLDLDKADALYEIDVYAGQTRAKFPSPGEWLGEEYRTAYDQSVQYKADGYPVSPVPPMVQSWLDHNDKSLATAQEAADDIIATGDTTLIPALESIREFRLEGKKAVKDATDQALIDAAKGTAKAKMDAIPVA